MLRWRTDEPVKKSNHRWASLMSWNPVKRHHVCQGLMVIPPWIWNLYNRSINPYYWVDDHPLLCGNSGSLDPGTCWNLFLIAFSSKIMRWHRQIVFMTSIWHASSIERQAGLYKQFCSCNRWRGTFQSWILLNLICELLLMVQISQTTTVWMYPTWINKRCPSYDHGRLMGHPWSGFPI